MDVAATPGGRMCHRCGKDLTGQVRYRDESGYWCAPCSKAEKKAYRANHLPCDDCGQDVQRGREHVLGDRRLCPVCHQKRTVQDVRQRMASEAEAQREERSRRRWRALRNWSLVAIQVLAAAVLIRYLWSLQPEAAAEPRPGTPQPVVVASGQAGTCGGASLSPAAAP